MEIQLYSDEAGKGVSIFGLLERVGQDRNAEAFRAAKKGLVKISGAVQVTTPCKLTERSVPLAKLPQMLIENLVPLVEERTFYPELDKTVDAVQLDRYEGVLAGGDIPDINDPNPRYKAKNYSPPFRITRIPEAFPNFLSNVSRSAGENLDMLRLVEEIIEVSSNHALTNGTLQGMVRRLRSVQDVARSMEARQPKGGKAWGPATTGMWPPANLHSEIKAYMAKIVPLEVVLDPPRDHDLLGYITRPTNKDRTTIRFNAKSDAGLLLRVTNEAVKRGTCIPQDLEFAKDLLDKLDTMSAKECKTYLAGPGAYLLNVMAKPKFEIADVELVDGVYRVKKTRIIFVCASATTLPAQLMYTMASSGHQQPDIANESRSLYGFNPFGGGLQHLLNIAFLDCGKRKSKEPSASRLKKGFAIFGYSDNLYLCWPTKDGMMWASLDGVKMEAQINFSKARLASSYWSDHLFGGAPPTNGWSNYTLVYLPMLATQATATLGKEEFLMKFMGSGVPGTFSNNQASGVVAVSYDVQKNFKPGEAAFWTNALKQTSEGWEFSEDMNELMRRIGAVFSIEKVCEIPLKHGGVWEVIPIDLLGFDMISLSKFGVNKYVPILDKKRLLKSYTFGHRPDKDETESEVVSFSALHRYVVICALYLVGGWAHEQLGLLMITEAHQKLASLVNAGLTIDRETLLEILVEQADLNEQAILSMMPIIESMRLPNPLTAISRLGLDEEELAIVRTQMIAQHWITETDEVQGSVIEHEGGKVMTIKELILEAEQKSKDQGRLLRKPLEERLDKPGKVERRLAEPGKETLFKPIKGLTRRPLPEFVSNAKFEKIVEELDELCAEKTGVPLALPALRPTPNSNPDYNFSVAGISTYISNRLDGVTKQEVIKIVHDQGYQFFDAKKKTVEIDDDGNMTIKLGDPVHNKPAAAQPAGPRQAARQARDHLERPEVKGPRLRLPASRDQQRDRAHDTLRRAQREAKQGGNG